eukprot:4718955-Pyramimonas_sp.AAC.1
MVIANTFFSKRPDQRFAYVGSRGRARQIDYIMVDRWAWRQVTDASSLSCVDLGSDHKAVCLKIRLRAKAHRNEEINQETAWANGWDICRLCVV